MTRIRSPQLCSLEELLDALHRRGIVRLGPAEQIQVAALLRTGRPWGRSALRAGLASMFATSRQQWHQIAHLFDLYFPPPDQALAQMMFPADRPSPQDMDPAAASRQSERDGPRRVSITARLGKTLAAVRNAPRWLLVVGLGLLLVAGLVLPIATLRVPTDLPPEEKEAEPTPPPAQEQRWRRHPEPLVHRQVEDRKHPPRPADLVDGLALGISCILLLVGLRWLGLPDRVRRMRAVHQQHSRQRALAERRRLGEQTERRSPSLHLSYQVKHHPPLPAEAVEDSATVLGRYFRAVAGDDLAVAATVQASIAAGGRFVPVYAAKGAPQALTVLVDRERGDYPWLGAVGWLLERWGALGVRFARFDFRSDPTFLAEQGSGRVVPLAQLARRAEGEPLLMIGRRLGVEGLHGRASWLAALDAWPCKAWLDPDPRLLSERRSERRVVRELERLGLRHFPFTHAGLLALARYLAEDASSIQAPAWEAPKPSTDPEVAAALARWAVLAALVPDATWDQLQALRRHFPELTAALPSPWYLQRLLEWVAQQHREQGIGPLDPESADGRTLALSDALVEQLITAQRVQEAGLPAAQRLEARGRRLLLAQLDATRPDDELLRQFWEVKRISHWLCVDPERALKLMGPLLGTAAEPELLRAVALELERQQGRPSLEPGIRDGLTVVAGRAENRIRPGELLGSPWRVWRRPLVVAGAVISGIIGALVAGDGLRDWLLRPDTGATVSHILPAIWEVEPTEAEFQDALPDGAKGPVMVRIPGGCFMMGSPTTEEGRYDDERLHEVCVEAFAIAKYEVTVGQFDRFVQATGYVAGAGGCYTVDADGQAYLDRRADWSAPGFAQNARHPVACVRWDDAQAYAAWLAQQTDTPYRLPTAAEWEYAARAGAASARYWGDDPHRACLYANVGDETAQRKYKHWSVHACNDGYLYTAPVGRFAGNAYGLHDVLGNVWEWTCSVYSADYDGSETRCAAAGSMDDARRVVRGGSWGNTPRFVRSAFRNRWHARGYRNGYLGFRLAQD